MGHLATPNYLKKKKLTLFNIGSYFTKKSINIRKSVMTQDIFIDFFVIIITLIILH